MHIPTFKYRLLVSILCIQLLFTERSNAQFPQLFFENITTQDGLSSNVVTCLYQDKKGFLWIGTTYGLNKYDGNIFQTFYMDEMNKNSLSGNSIVEILEDESDIFWIATRDGGLTRYDPAQPRDKQFMQIKHDEHDSTSITSDRMTAIFNLNEDYLLISAEGMSLGFLNKKTFEVTHPHTLRDSLPDEFLNPAKSIQHCLSGNWVHHFSSDENYIYVSYLASGGRVYIYDRKTYEQKTKKFEVIVGSNPFFEVDGKRIWYASWSKGLYVQDNYSPEAPMPLKHQQVLDIPDEVTHIISFNDNILFASTRNSGVYMVDKNNFSYKKILHDRSDKNSIASNRVICMLKDKDQIWWMGTNNGLSKYNPLEWQFTAEEITSDYSRDITHYSMSEIDGVLRICTSNGIYKRLPGQESFTLLNLKYRDINLEPTQIYPVEGGRYILNTENTSFWYDPSSESVSMLEIDSFYSFAKNKFYDLDPLNRGSYQVRDMFTDSINGNYVYVFATLGWGIGIYDYHNRTLYDFAKMGNTGLGNNMTRVLFRDRNNNYWVGTAEGLYKWNKSYPFKNDFEGYNFVAGDSTTLSHNSISGIYQDSKGIFWIATNNGLNAFDGKQFTRYKTPFASSTFMYEIYPDEKENLWIAVSDGFEVFNLETRVFHHINLPNRQWTFKYPAKILKNPDGTWMYGAGNNLVRFKPDDYYFETSHPEVYLTGFSVFDDHIFQTAAFADLSFKHKENFITISFSSLQLSQPQTVKYQYRLKGLNDNWIELGHNGTATFTSLPPGHYTFFARVTNPQGTWGKETALVTFSIAHPFWQQWWFFLLCFMLCAAIVYVIIKYREKQFMALQNIRNKIASDLHDDVGSALSTINLYSEVAKMKSADEELTGILNKISDTSIEMQDNMSQIVWSLEPRNDVFEQMILRLKNYATETLQVKNIHTLFESDEEVKQVKLSPEKRRELFLIYKEAIHNILKYAGGKKVQFRFSIKKKMFEMIIHDDGAGFESTEKFSGNGLHTMQQRAKKLKGNLKIESKPGSGTKIILAFPVS